MPDLKDDKLLVNIGAGLSVSVASGSVSPTESASMHQGDGDSQLDRLFFPIRPNRLSLVWKGLQFLLHPFAHMK